MESGIVKPAFKGNLFALTLVVFQLVAAQFIIPPLAKQFGLGTVMILNQFIFLILPLIIYFLFTRENLKKTLKFNKVYASEVLIMILIALLSQPIAGICAYISSFFSENVVSQVIQSLNGIPYFQLISIMAVTPAICEELTMRGVILSGAKNHNIIKASIVNGLIFGMIHLTGSQLLYATFLGIIFAYIVRITNSIFSSCIIHLVFNGFNMSMGYFSGKLLENQDIASQVEDAAINSSSIAEIIFLGLIAILAVYIIILLIGSIKRKRIRLEGEEVMNLRILGNPIAAKNDPIINLPFIILVLLYLVIMFLL